MDGCVGDCVGEDVGDGSGTTGTGSGAAGAWLNGAKRAPRAVSVSVGSAADDASAVPRTVGLNSFFGVVLES